MSISFSCPHCASRMTVPDHLAGKRGNCSKCKKLIMVPAVANGEAPAAAAKAAPPTRAAAPARPAPPPPPPVPVRPAPPTVNLDDEAAALLADAPTDEEKQGELIEFNCPQCDEPIKLGLELAGKRHPCPNCRKVIPVPVPKVRKKSDWRDTGPKLPTGAKREALPELEGAWGTATKTGPSETALREAGVIQDKAKPKTRLQKAAPYLLVLVPLLLIGSGAWFYRTWRAGSREKRALTAALDYAKSDKGQKALGPDGQAALYTQAGRYYLTNPKGADGAKEHFGKVITLAQGLRSPAREELLTDVLRLLLDLGGPQPRIDAGERLKWDEVQKLLVSALAVMLAPQPGNDALAEAGRDALRLTCAGLIARDQGARVMPLVSQAVRQDGAARAEAMALAGLELLRAGKTAEAAAAAIEAEKPYKDKKGKRPLLRPAVVALAKALKRPDVKWEKNTTVETEPYDIGRADGLARLGQLNDARKVLESIVESRARLRGYIAIAGAALDTKSGDAAEAVKEAVNYLKSNVSERAGLDWELIRLIDLALAAGVPDTAGEVLDKFPQSDGQANPLAPWARLRVVRDQLSRSKQVEAPALVEAIPADAVAGRLARLELARHNTRQDGGWADAVKDWPEGVQAFGNLGVAMGMQRAK